VVHAIQTARKAAGLDVSDRIALTLGGADELLAAAREHEPYVTGEVLATAVAYDGTQNGHAVDIDGMALRIAVTKS
jgi:isoleucyl-tRNA synthetase